MTVNSVNVPNPQNNNADRAMYVWVPQVGGASDPLGSDSNQQTLFNFCSLNGVNVVFLDMWRYLGGSNWNTNNQQTVKKFISVAHASGIRVMALAGDTGWPSNQQWVMRNILRRISNFNSMSDAVSSSYEGGAFDGVIFDVEYWTASYTEDDVKGFLNLMKAAKSYLNIPVGCFVAWWQIDPNSSALNLTYDGVTQIEGKHIADVADFVSVACYKNTAANQISCFQQWYDYLSDGAHVGSLWCTSITDSGQPAGTSYWTGFPGAKAAMEAAHTTISNQFIPSPCYDTIFRGQAIQAYASYSQMT